MLLSLRYLNQIQQFLQEFVGGVLLVELNEETVQKYSNKQA
ncbi:hypothetical protein PZE06_16000 [Robertmurraya sp. DFI.2.37]|nr:hypothetical protein [Robertmurraya sp. DFI.2.37]MDF1509644.1 hypothetical protein [Robertmurraya sp. DFI.2.37]